MTFRFHIFIVRTLLEFYQKIILRWHLLTDSKNGRKMRVYLHFLMSKKFEKVREIIRIFFPFRDFFYLFRIFQGFFFIVNISCPTFFSACLYHREFFPFCFFRIFLPFQDFSVSFHGVFLVPARTLHNIQFLPALFVSGPNINIFRW